MFIFAWTRSSKRCAVPEGRSKKRDLFGASADVDARVSELAERKRTALERAHAAATTTAIGHRAAQKLLGLEVSKGQLLQRHQHRPRRSPERAVELSKVG